MLHKHSPPEVQVLKKRTIQQYNILFPTKYSGEEPGVITEMFQSLDS